MMNITYTIDNMDRQTSDGFTRGDSFTPFEQLTQEQVIDV